MPVHAAEAGQNSSNGNEVTIEGAVPITLRINGKDRQLRSQPFPARTAIVAAALPLGACVEIDLIVKA